MATQASPFHHRLLALCLCLFTTCHGFVVPHQRLGIRREELFPPSFVASSSPNQQQDNRHGAQESTTRPAALLDPYSKQAIDILRNEIHLSSSQITKIQRLADLVCDWNTRVNLVSRKDCSPSVVFSRHILPCLCYEKHLPEGSIVMDVGTGGGFPGLVLAIQYDSSCEFILLDAIGKKLVAVSDMVEQLQLSNVKSVHHGRVEDFPEQTVDIVTGRGVSDIRAFMGATRHLFRSSNGQLVYWTGGDTNVDESQWCSHRLFLRTRIPGVMDPDDDKRILTFDLDAVKALARGQGRKQSQGSQLPAKRENQRRRRSSQPAKGAWNRRDNSVKKQRGYEGFKRYDSTAGVRQTGETNA